MKSRGAAMISLTGDAELTRHLRLKAIKQGMHLNEFGLWRWVSYSFPGMEETEGAAETEEAEENEQSGYWQLMRATTEEDIFEQLGMDFVEPHRRNFAFINQRAVPMQKKTTGESAS
jgi:DNA polymerase beta